ncbi:recombinase family protein [Paenibacillus pabuli]|uniref:recombinase family protein n=1 Tax=Paenibacillus pabuli TaxID=1472 RepID=UPI001FFE94A5|nr:recombinase family protein [Paenibacillus pabuli]
MIAIYIRVSTEEQAEQGYSIDGQKSKLIAFCDSQGWQEYKLYIDDGYTGTKIERPALKRMIRHIEEGKISTVLVYKLDRLSRKQKDVLSLIEDVFEKNNVSFRSSTELFDTSTPFGKAMIGVLAVFAQLDRDMIVERTTFGRRERVKKGKWYGGRVPFGYTWNKEAQALEVDVEAARIIKNIFKMYLEGHSRLAIAEWANGRTTERNIDHNVIRDMLERPVYIGKLKNAGSLEEGEHESIIDISTWEAVQQERRKRGEGVTPLGEYLLTGLLKCGVCGGNIVHVKRITKRKEKTYEYHLYACQKQHVRIKDRKENCTLGYSRREQVEEYVLNQVKSLITNPSKVDDFLKQDDQENDQESTIDQLTDQLNKVNTNLENLYDAIQSGDIKASAVSDRIRKLEEQREYIENDLDEILDETRQSGDMQVTKAIVKQLGAAWDYFTEDEQKAALKKLIKFITLHKDDDPKITWFFSK